MVYHITAKILKGRDVSCREASELYLGKTSLFDLMWAANTIRERFKKNRIGFCSVVNAKSGLCGEDCKFCAQSVHHKTGVRRYPLMPQDEIVMAAKQARDNGAGCFGIVTSGRAITDKEEIMNICRAVRKIRKKLPGLDCALSLGILDKASLDMLKSSGALRFHHNLETSRKYFPRICSTHSYEERLKTLKAARSAGFKICSGGIFGLGETRPDRLDLAFTLRELKVDSIPLNFLHPIKGTALEKAKPMSPAEILRVIAIFRIIHPKKDIKVCGGRVVNLRRFEPMIFFAGANGMMIGNYLTQPGQDPAADLEMVKDLGLKIV
ncbi:MAG: biotin synthase BioB [Candidatus Omnitrophica bacterium]|nr:biotin synthase BioB [Candidatus Omnitrophota bacterium]